MNELIMHLLLVHTGPEFPTYLNDCVAQIRCISKISIVVLIDGEYAEKVLPCDGLTVVPLESLPEDQYAKEYIRTSKLDASFRGGFWRAASLRFFYIHTYTRLHGLQDIFHIEYDNLIYQDFTKFLGAFQTRRMWCVLDSPTRCVPSFLYWRDSDAVFDVVLSLLSAAPRGLNDMEALALHTQAYPKAVGLLPIVTRDYAGAHPVFSSASILFGHLFDGAAVGQYVGGVDPRNIPGNTCGFINETAAFRCDRVTLEWRRGDNGLVRPFMNSYPLVNLHIHSKELSRWSSRAAHVVSVPQKIITGEAIQALCDNYCCIRDDFQFNPRFFSEMRKFMNLAADPAPWNNPRLLFCYPHRLGDFRKWLPFLQNRFILVTHNSDENVTDVYADIFDCPLLIVAYVQNKCFAHPKVNPLPIGIANRLWPHGNLEALASVQALDIPKMNLIYFYFNVSTNTAAREQCRAALEAQGLRFGSPVAPADYLRDLASYKYAICPPGNGVDSHRVWECLYLGVTPILLRSAFSSELAAAGFPCVLLDNWSDLDITGLAAAWRPHSAAVAANLDFQTLAARIQSGSPSWLIHE